MKEVDLISVYRRRDDGSYMHGMCMPNAVESARSEGWIPADDIKRKEACVDTFNKFGVGVSIGTDGDGEVVLTVISRTLKTDDALNLAAWIVAIADRDGKFDALLRAVQNT